MRMNGEWVNGEFGRAKCKVKRARVGGICRWLRIAIPRYSVLWIMGIFTLNKKRTNFKNWFFSFYSSVFCYYKCIDRFFTWYGLINPILIILFRCI